MSKELVIQLVLLTAAVMLLFWILLNPAQPVTIPDERLLDVVDRSLAAEEEIGSTSEPVDPDIERARQSRIQGVETVYNAPPARRETTF